MQGCGQEENGTVYRWTLLVPFWDMWRAGCLYQKGHNPKNRFGKSWYKMSR